MARHRLRRAHGPAGGWRFDDAIGPFRFLFWDDGQLGGYLILRGGIARSGSRAGILDWEASEPQIKRELLSAAVCWGRFKSVDIWSASLDAETKETLSGGLLGRANWDLRMSFTDA